MCELNTRSSLRCVTGSMAYSLVLWGAALLLLGVLIVLYAYGLDNYLVSDDWRFVYQAAKTVSFADIQRSFHFRPLGLCDLSSGCSPL